jgi:hypothetical protein
MNWEGARKESRTSHGVGIQMSVTFGGRISAWGVCDARCFGPSLDRWTREKEKLLTVRNSAAGALPHLSEAADDSRNGLPI